MNDVDRAAKNIGNRFDLVLVASERMREIHRDRRTQEQSGDQDTLQRKHVPIPSAQALTEIEQGKVGTEYLARIQERKIARRPRLDEI